MTAVKRVGVVGCGLMGSGIVVAEYMFFRGARKAPEEVTISWEDFERAGLMLVECQTRIARAIETLEGGAPTVALSILNGG